MGKKSKKSDLESSTPKDDGNIHDKRFTKAQTHPQFQKKYSKKVENDHETNFIGEKEEVDERFQAVFNDSRFAIGGNVELSSDGIDKYGRKQGSRKKKEASDNHTSDKGYDEGVSDNEMNSMTGNESSSEEKDEDRGGDKHIQEDPESRIAYLTALSRGEIEESSSSSSEDESSDISEVKNHIDSDGDSDENSDEDSIYDKPGVLDPTTGDEIEITFEDSPFLAICNTEWSHVRAVDLLSIVSSFAPPGSVKSVKVFPSDFGMERMEKDKLVGPVGIWKKEKGQEGKEGKEAASNNCITGGDKVSNKNDDTIELGEGDDESDASSSEINDVINEQYDHFLSHADAEKQESDFDPEKLREYEASKLKYYFAVVEFTSSAAADVAYKEVDGMEFGHSSTMLDLRSIPKEEIPNITKDRPMRDEASMIPSNYNPPDFVVNALQQTSVQCTWEEGDTERERLLTQYGCGKEAWAAMTEGDDLKAYLASDASSNEDESDVDRRKTKASNMRKMLGLDSDDSEDGSRYGSDGVADEDSFFGSDGEDNSEAKQVAFIPGKSNLEEKIRTKLKEKEEEEKGELTPWEKHQLKRKEKRKEKKRMAKEAKSKAKVSLEHGPNGSKGMSYKSTDLKELPDDRPSSKEELGLLLAGDISEEDEKDFHMREILRVEKNKGKKLRGTRKRKEQELAANVSGANFELDVTDDRFASVLDGDDARFGIDKTDPQYKETSGMKTLLSEQTKRRRKKRRKASTLDGEARDSEANKNPMLENDKSQDLNSLVQKIKKKVTST